MTHRLSLNKVDTELERESEGRHIAHEKKLLPSRYISRQEQKVIYRFRLLKMKRHFGKRGLRTYIINFWEVKLVKF